MIRKGLLYASAGLFCAFEAVMFYFIHISRENLGFNLHYACIIAAAAFSVLTLLIKLLTARESGEDIHALLLNTKDGNLIRIAMMFTLVADYFLVAASEVQELWGVIFFLGTQLFIFLHIMANDEDKRARKLHIIFRLSLMAVIVCIAFAVLGESADALSVVSVIYYANLCTNAIFAHRSGKGGIMLTVGLIFFALCDINVGLSALNSMYTGGFPEGSLLYELMRSDVDLIWIFYIPSQTLIPMTLLLCDKKTEKTADKKEQT